MVISLFVPEHSLRLSLIHTAHKVNLFFCMNDALRGREEEVMEVKKET